jgi:hypothetical protein
MEVQALNPNATQHYEGVDTLRDALILVSALDQIKAAPSLLR